MSQALQLGSIGQIARTVKDIAAARDWYGRVLGLPHLYSFGDLAFFDCGGVRLFLRQAAEPGAESIMYFRVEDIHAVHACLVDRGVRFQNAPHLIHRHDDGMEEWMDFFDDPDGGTLALMAQVRR
jgi:catechol 2,3-dioxygenase-like lactoylglutathione lyase family enzyme